jgi:putative transcriptional regulator
MPGIIRVLTFVGCNFWSVRIDLVSDQAYILEERSRGAACPADAASLAFARPDMKFPPARPHAGPSPAVAATGARQAAAGHPRVANTIRRLRFDHGEMTQAALAEAVGVTRQTIIALEGGRYAPSLELAFRIAAVFGCPLEAVFQYRAG